MHGLVRQKKPTPWQQWAPYLAPPVPFAGGQAPSSFPLYDAQQAFNYNWPSSQQAVPPSGPSFDHRQFGFGFHNFGTAVVAGAHHHEAALGSHLVSHPPPPHVPLMAPVVSHQVLPLLTATQPSVGAVVVAKKRPRVSEHREQRRTHIIETVKKILTTVFAKILDELKTVKSLIEQPRIPGVPAALQRGHSRSADRLTSPSDSSGTLTAGSSLQLPILTGLHTQGTQYQQEPGIRQGSPDGFTGFPPSTPREDPEQQARVPAHKQQQVVAAMWPSPKSPVRASSHEHQCSVCGVAH